MRINWLRKCLEKTIKFAVELPFNERVILG